MERARVQFLRNNEWIKTVQSTFHGFFCLWYTYWNIYHSFSKQWKIVVWQLMIGRTIFFTCEKRRSRSLIESNYEILRCGFFVIMYRIKSDTEQYSSCMEPSQSPGITFSPFIFTLVQPEQCFETFRGKRLLGTCGAKRMVRRFVRLNPLLSQRDFGFPGSIHRREFSSKQLLGYVDQVRHKDPTVRGRYSKQTYIMGDHYEQLARALDRK